MQCFILAIIVLCIMSWNMWIGIGISIFSIISSMIIKGVQANHYYAQPMAFIHGNWTQGGHGGNVHLDHPFFANRLVNLKTKISALIFKLSKCIYENGRLFSWIIIWHFFTEMQRW